MKNDGPGRPGREAPIVITPRAAADLLVRIVRAVRRGASSARRARRRRDRDRGDRAGPQS